MSRCLMASLITLIYSATAALPATAEESIENLNWMDCVRETALNNPALEQAIHDLQNKEFLHKASYSSLLPQITASSSATKSFNANQGLTVGGSSSGAQTVTTFGSSSTISQYATDYDFQLSLQQQIFDGFKAKGNIEQAKANVRLALAGMLSERAEVSYELKSAFAQLLYAQELVGISASIVDERQINYRLVELNFEGGTENKGSLLLSRANLSQANLDLAQARRGLAVSQRQLLTVMGRTSFRPVRAIGTLTTGSIPENPDFRALSLKTPAHFEEQASADAQKANITIEQSGLYPQIEATAAVTRQNELVSSQPLGWSVGIDASLNVFDGASTYFNVRAARASFQQALANMHNTDQDTAQTLAEDYKTYIDDVGQVPVARELLEAQALRARIGQEQYRNGLLSFQDFNNITDSYVSQRKTELQSRRDAVIAEAAWEQYLGISAIP